MKKPDVARCDGRLYVGLRDASGEIDPQLERTSGLEAHRRRGAAIRHRRSWRNGSSTCFVSFIVTLAGEGHRDPPERRVPSTAGRVPDPSAEPRNENC